ncbi:hypothetical protein QU487_04250 [Crenobacter sp. SG2305]|uniref:hypothetical protein n=1 Tax=Crenobacter oryzisoli TaxID=3056844 RepID=UPI0025AB5B76|nr:hypothetical protein [Crenobacter sp. SG2305]MDN0081966.1 hypothetical protein [Crenobacter sp. SG2305]
MYDWTALWEDHAAEQHPLTGTHDVNALASTLAAKLIEPAGPDAPLAVYETATSFVLVGVEGGQVQQLTLAKRDLFDLTLRFVTEDEGQDQALPYLEIIADNIATGESDAWRATVTLDEQGRPWVANRLLAEQLMPAFEFDTLSFTDAGSFREALHSLWINTVPQLVPHIVDWFSGEQDSGVAPIHDDARTREMLERYAEIVRHEQAALGRRFVDAELRLVAEVLHGIRFDSAASCRGLWLAVEARLIDEELDRKWKVDGDVLLEKLKNLSYAQEVALIEGLTASGGHEADAG